MKYTFYILVLLVVLVFLDYTLPSRDVVKVVGTEVVRTNMSRFPIFWTGSDTGSTAASQTVKNRDIRFINTVKPSERPRVYRNEDTAWGWPPYFKFDSGDLQAEAQRLKDGSQWVAVTHYGWRIQLISIYPNAIKIAPVPGPGVSYIPWARIIAGILLVLTGLIIWRLWVRLREWLTDRIDRLKARFF